MIVYILFLHAVFVCILFVTITYQVFDYALLISTLPVHSPALFPESLPISPVLAVANTGSCVGPQNKIGYPA